MDLGYSELQTLLRQTARDFATRSFPLSRHRELLAAGRSFDAGVWAEICALGWPGLIVPEAYGGAGGSWLDLVVLAEELGRNLLPPAFLSHVVAGALIAGTASDAQRAELLPGVAGGNPLWAIATTEDAATLAPEDILAACEPIAAAGDSSAPLAHPQMGEGLGVRARGGHPAISQRSERTAASGSDGGGYTLTGVKHFVRGAMDAARLLVAARVNGGIGFFVVPAGAPGLTVTPLDVVGDDGQAKLRLDGVGVPHEALLGGVPRDDAAFTSVLDMGALAEAAYGLGVMARDCEMTVEYVKNRVQFGRPIGSFQSVQHDVSDQVTDVDAGRYLVYRAAWALDERLPSAGREISIAKAWVSDALRRVTLTGQQLHGGIGFSRETDLHFFYLRAKAFQLMWGTADEHRERIAASLLD